jgi:ABC-type glycerol-3-phosphate transport system permease component
MYPVSLEVAGYFAIGAKYPTNIVMTAAMLSAIPVVVCYVLFNRLIVQGIARSGLSG